MTELKAENKALGIEASENFKKAVTAESELAKTLERLDDSRAELSREAQRHNIAADKAAATLAEKEEQLKALTGRLEKAIMAEIESAQGIKTLQREIALMKEQNELNHTYLDAINKIAPADHNVQTNGIQAT